MGFIREYATGIIVVSVFAILCDSLVPEGNLKKYVKTVVGLVVMLVIVSPVTRLPFYADTFQIPVIQLEGDSADAAQLERTQADTLRSQFESDMARRLEQELLNRFGVQTEVTVTAALDMEGSIAGVGSVQVVCETRVSDGELTAWLSTQLGLEKANITIQ